MERSVAPKMILKILILKTWSKFVLIIRLDHVSLKTVSLR